MKRTLFPLQGFQSSFRQRIRQLRVSYQYPKLISSCFSILLPRLWRTSGVLLLQSFSFFTKKGNLHGNRFIGETKIDMSLRRFCHINTGRWSANVKSPNLVRLRLDHLVLLAVNGVLSSTSVTEAPMFCLVRKAAAWRISTLSSRPHICHE